MGWARVDLDGLGVEGRAAVIPSFELAGEVCRFGVLAESSVHLKGLARELKVSALQALQYWLHA